MAKGQQKSNKEAKKPKKNAATSKSAAPLTDTARVATVNTVYTRIKNKDK